MIRFATPTDLEQIKVLWKICFDDSESYVSRFLSTIGIANRCLVYETDGRVVSMLFVLPASMIVQGDVKQIHYIYACATSPGYRGKGIMAKLLDAAAQTAVYALVLIPANIKLSAYYKKLDFVAFSNKPQFPKILSLDGKPLDDDSIRSIITIRKRHITSELSVQWSDEILRFALTDFAESGGVAIVEGDSYLLFEKKSGEVKEQMPIPLDCQASTSYSLIRFCESSKLSTDAIPYFNWGLD